MADLSQAENRAAIKIFQERLLNEVRAQSGAIFDDQVEDISLRLKKRLKRLYAEFKLDLAAAIGQDQTPSIVGAGGLGSVQWPELTIEHEDRKTKLGGTPPQFFLFKGNLQSYFEGLDVEGVFGPIKVIRDSKSVIDRSSGRVRIRKGLPGAGRFAKDVESLVTNLRPDLFPKATPEMTSATVNTLFPVNISNRLWNRNRPFRPLVGPIINFYRTTKLNAAINEVLQNG